MRHLLMLLLLLPALSGCKNTVNNEWSNINYSRIARDNYLRENDASYTPPAELGCLDDDIYTCPTYSPYRR